MPWPSGFPPWQEQVLQSLAAQGKLSGLNPLDIAGIEEAETGGWSGGAINPSGYGGYFGLSTADGPTAVELNTGGASTPPSASTLSSYTVQAQDAANIFSQQLQRYGGNIAQAETGYQDGSYSGTPSGGAAIVESVVGTDSAGNPTPGGTVGSGGGANTVSAAGTGSSNAIKLTGIAGVLQEINDLMNPPSASTLAQITSLGTAGVVSSIEGYLVRGLFALAFLGIAYTGVKQITGGSAPNVTNILPSSPDPEAVARRELAERRVIVSEQESARKAGPQPVRRSHKTSESHVYYHPNSEPGGPGPNAPSDNVGAGV